MEYQKIKILRNPPYEDVEMVKSFARAFSKNDYEIDTLKSFSRRTPDGLFKIVRKSYLYRRVLQDKSAEPAYFAINFSDKDSTFFTMPIGVFGVSKLHGLCFPLLINWFWRYFLMMNKGSLAALLKLQCGREADLSFDRLLFYREHLVKKIFSYYKTAMGQSDHVMMWAARGEKSLTRRVAESEGYIRFCMNDIEIYSSSPFASDRKKYIDRCVESWQFTQDKVVSFISPNMPIECGERVDIFLSEIFNSSDGKLL